MRPFNDLTDRGRARRLRGVVQRALTHYPLQIQRITLLTNDWNCVFRLDATDGSRYVMRVCLPEFDAAETRSEITWMLAVSQESDVPVPTPIKTRDGDVVVIESAPGVPEPRICVVLSWIQGDTINEPTLKDAYQWGSLTARLHAHAATYKPPDGFTRIAYKSVFPFHTDRLVLFDDVWKPLVGEGVRRDIFRQGLDKAESAIQALFEDQTDLRLIHNDLHLWNIMRYRTHYAVIDFEDCMWGYPVQDSGTSLYYVLHEPHFSDLLAAYRSGYTAHLPWVEREAGQLDSMIMARAFNMLNIMLQYTDPADYGRYTERAAELEGQLRRYLNGDSII